MQSFDPDGNDRLVKKCKILPLEEQKILWKRYKEKNDKEALEKLIFCHLRFAYSIVDSLNNSQFREELKAEAYYAVIKAIEFWNPEKGRLTTIIMPMVRQAAAKYLQEACKTIRVPVTAQHFYKENSENIENYDLLNKRQKIKLSMIGHIENIKRLTPKLLAQIEDGGVMILKNDTLDNKELVNSLLYRISLLDAKSKYIVEHYFGIKEPKETLTGLSRKLKCLKGAVKNSLIQALVSIKQMGNCLWCGKKFTPNRRFRYHCCVECKQLETSNKKSQYTVCNYCQKLFIPTKRYKKYCSRQCKTYARADRRYDKLKKNRDNLIPGWRNPRARGVDAPAKASAPRGSCKDARVKF